MNVLPYDIQISHFVLLDPHLTLFLVSNHKELTKNLFQTFEMIVSLSRFKLKLSSGSVCWPLGRIPMTAQLLSHYLT